MVGLISAMRVEIEALLNDMRDKRTVSCGHMSYTAGKLYGKDTALCVCGPGKVNAAAYTDTLIHLFAPDYVINLGVAGAVGKALDIGDIVIADQCVQHDLDATALGDPPGLVWGLDLVDLPCDQSLADKLALAAKGVPGLRMYRGRIATGDQFISGPQMKKKIADLFDCLACEMEGGAVAQVCYLRNIPVCVVRSISDNADGSAHMDYAKFTQLAAGRSMALVRAVFETL